jgi:hypothetical protein
MLLAATYFVFAYRMFFRTTPRLADPAPLSGPPGSAPRAGGAG